MPCSNRHWRPKEIKAVRALQEDNSRARNQRASDILTGYLQHEEEFASKSAALLCMETALRADLICDSDTDRRSLWFQFRSDLCRIFLKETGVHLPICCRFPSANLYRAFREHHAAQRQSR